MSAPLAYTVHPGGRIPDGPAQQILAQWLPANGINPSLVAAHSPITVLPVPYASSDGEGPWMIQVIVFDQFHVDHTGAKEHNMITGQPVTFQRTVPLRVPFPTDPTTDGEDHGQAGRETAEQAAEVEVRDARQEGVPDRYEGQGPERPGQGEPVRNEGAAEEGPGRGDEAVSEPEEDRQEVRQEEVGAR